MDGAQKTAASPAASHRWNTDPLPLLTEVFAVGGRVPLAVTGGSMRPFLREGRDTVLLSAPKRVKKGDVVFFRRINGQWVLHRVVAVKADGYLLNGDAQLWTEPVPVGRVMAVVTGVRRGEKEFSTRALRWRVPTTLWRWMRPCRRWMLALWRRRPRRKEK